MGSPPQDVGKLHVWVNSSGQHWKASVPSFALFLMHNLMGGRKHETVGFFESIDFHSDHDQFEY